MVLKNLIFKQLLRYYTMVIDFEICSCLFFIALAEEAAAE